jgi:hypothetical protein
MSFKHFACLATTFFAGACAWSAEEQAESVATEVKQTEIITEVKQTEIIKEDKDVIPDFKSTPITAFTGQLTGEQVRVRLQPNTESKILKEINEGDYVLVIGEKEDFYAVKPLPGMKAYVFRTYVLDDLIEGYRVNVRLEPNLDSPVIAQLNTGDPAKGLVSPLNSKWLQIEPPEGVEFFIAKDYIKQVGGPELITQYTHKKDQVKGLLNTAFLVSQSELRKPFPEIDLSKLEEKFQSIITDYSDFSEQVKQASEGLEFAKDAYLRKKVAFLEEQNRKLSQQVDGEKELVEEVASVEPSDVLHLMAPPPQEIGVMETNLFKEKAQIWEPIEDMYYQEWAKHYPQASKDDFYTHAKLDAQTVSGVVEPYTRQIKNKPGDFILRDLNDVPVGYIYSTQVDLDELIGKEVSLTVISRPNHHFAFPAYYVLSTE